MKSMKKWIDIASSLFGPARARLGSRPGVSGGSLSGARTACQPGPRAGDLGLARDAAAVAPAGSTVGRHRPHLLLVPATAGIVFLALAVSSLVTPSRAQCFASNGSYQESQDSCGNTWFGLTALVDGGVPRYYEDAEAYGSCTAGFYDCDNNWVDPSFIPGGQDMQEDFSTDYSDFVYWELDDIIVQGYPSCNNGNPNDLQIEAADDVGLTPDFEAQCY